MADQVLINKQQAEGWAQEMTLRALLKETESNSQILDKWVEKATNLSDKEREELKKTRADSNKNSADLTKAVNGIKPTVDMSIGDAFKDLSSDLKYAVSDISRGLKSGDVSSVMSGLSRSTTELGKGLLSHKEGLTVGEAAARKLGGAMLLYVGAATAAWQIMTSLNVEFSKLYESGMNVTGGLQGLNEAASTMGISAGDLAQTFTNFGAAVTYLGTDRAVKLGKQMGALSNETAALGMTNQQAVEAVLEYSEFLRSSGALQGKTNEELAKGSLDYYQELTKIATATGKSRKEIEKATQARMKDLDTQLVLRSLPQQMREKVMKSMQSLEILGPEAAKASGDFMTTFLAGKGVAGLDPALRNALAQSNLLETMETMGEKAKKGENIADEMGKFGEALRPGSELFQQMSILAKSGGPAGDMARKITELSMSTDNYRKINDDLREQARKELGENATAQQIEDRVREIRTKKEKELTAANADQLRAQNAMQRATKVLQGIFQTFALNVLEPLLPVIELVGDAISGLSSVFRWVSDAIASAFSWLPGTKKTVDKDGNQQVTGGTAKIVGDVAAVGVPVALAVLASSTVGAAMMSRLKTMLGNSAIGNALGGVMQKLPMPNFMQKLLGGAGGAAGAVGSAAGGAARGVGSALGGLGRGLAGIGKGAGNMIGGVLKGLASGLAALGNPRVLLGTMSLVGISSSFLIASKAFETFGKVSWEDVLKGLVAMTGLGALAGVASLIAGPMAIGAAAFLAVGAAAYVVGAGLESMAKGVNAFSAIDGSKLKETAAGMLDLSKAIAAMGAGEFVGALGGLGASILGFFQEDPIKKLKRFSELGEPLALAGLSMQLFAEVYPKAMDAINSARFDPSGLAGLDRLKEIFAGDSLFTSIGKGLASLFGGGQNDFVTQLTKFSNSAEDIGKLGSSIDTFTSAYSKLIDTMNRAANPAAMAYLTKLVDVANQANAKPGFFSSIFGSSALPAAPAALEPAPAAPTSTAETEKQNLDKKTAEYYDNMKLNTDNMVALLQGLIEKVDNLERATRDGSADVARSISKSSPNLF